jgi:flagellar protein FliS
VSTTTNQQQLIVMAYDGILRFLSQAKEHIERQEIEAKYNMLFKARAVVEELASTLNPESGGEIARNLWNLYVFFMQKIGEANLTNDPAHIDGILPAVKELRDAWAEMEIPEDDVQAQALNRRVPTREEAQRVSITG